MDDGRKGAIGIPSKQRPGQKLKYRTIQLILNIIFAT